MMKKILLQLLGIFVFSATVFLWYPKQAHANIFDAIVNGVKNILAPNDSQKFTITSHIALAPDGDVNKNGQIDAGDTVRFTVTITNRGNKPYRFATVKTNINRKNISSLTNIHGATGIDDSDGKTIMIPNIRIEQNQVKVVSFDALINYFHNNDTAISIEPEFFSQEKTSIFKAVKEEVIAKKIPQEKFNELLHGVKLQ